LTYWRKSRETREWEFLFDNQISGRDKTFSRVTSEHIGRSGERSVESGKEGNLLSAFELKA
jgi:hypothetical protein